MNAIQKALNEIEEAMHHHLESPLKGDFMSLTRANREILVELWNEGYRQGEFAASYKQEMREGRKRAAQENQG